MARDVILATDGLTMEFKGFRAVNGVKLEVERGTIHALIGPNGAGKTTCFNLLTKFLIPTAGTIRYKDRDITGMRAADVARGRAESGSWPQRKLVIPIMAVAAMEWSSWGEEEEEAVEFGLPLAD